MSRSGLALLALALLPFAPLPSRAQTTPESAHALEQQLTNWLAMTLGPAAKLNNRPVQITAEGDHYAVAVPFGNAPDAPQVTAQARQIDGGRWSIDDIHSPSPFDFHLNVPEPGSDGKAAGGPTVPVTYHVSIGQQAGQIVFDPSYATASTLNSTIGNLDVHATGTGHRTAEPSRPRHEHDDHPPGRRRSG